jgi:hypothetical protein
VCWTWLWAGELLPAIASPHPAVSKVVLVAGLSLILGGCAHLEPDAPVRTALLAPADTRIAPEPPMAPMPAAAPAKPAQPRPQQPQRVSETKPPPAIATQGAERLVVEPPKDSEKPAAPSEPAPKQTIQPPTAPPEPPAANPPVAQAPNPVNAAPEKDLILKGPPHQIQTWVTRTKLMGWLGIGLGTAALAILGCLYAQRRAKPSEPPNAKKAKSIAPGLLLKQPILPPQETVTAERA